MGVVSMRLLWQLARRRQESLFIMSVRSVTEEVLSFRYRVPIAESDDVDDVEAKIHFLEKEYFPRVIQEKIIDNI